MKRLSVILIISAIVTLSLSSCSDRTNRNDRYNAAPETNRSETQTTENRMADGMLPSTNIPDSTQDGAAERAADKIKDGIDNAADRMADGADDAKRETQTTANSNGNKGR